jgi:hypothetical protein
MFAFTCKIEISSVMKSISMLCRPSDVYNFLYDDYKHLFVKAMFLMKLNFRCRCLKLLGLKATLLLKKMLLFLGTSISYR